VYIITGVVFSSGLKTYMVPPDGSIIHLPAHRFTVYTVEQDFTFEIKFYANG